MPALKAFSLVLAGYVLLAPASALSVGTDARIRVVPLECIIEEVNNGISETYFLGPLECENKLNPPIVVPDGSDQTGSSQPRVPSAQGGQSPAINDFIESGFEEESQDTVSKPDIEFSFGVSLLERIFGKAGLPLILIIMFFINAVLSIFGKPLRFFLVRFFKSLRELI
jgi:hypothetical protein